MKYYVLLLSIVIVSILSLLMPVDSVYAGNGIGQLDDPKGVAVDSSGNIYVADARNDRIQKFDSSGNFILKWGTSCIISSGLGCVDPDGAGPLELGDGQLDDPKGVAVDSSGNIYVADARNDRIQKFDSAGNFVLKFGSVGTGDGQLDDPHGVAVDSSGNIYVADKKNDRIQKFDSAGNFVLKFGNGAIPDKPTDVTSVLTSKTTTSVSWVAPTDEGSTPITGYQIERSIQGGIWEIIEDDTGNTSTSFDDPEVLIKNTAYEYRVRAINSYGLGLPAQNNAVITQSGSSQAGFDTKAPSFTKLFSENEYPLTIDDQSFTVSQLSGKVETTKVYIGEPVQIKLRVYENKGPSNVWEVLLHTNLHGFQRELYQSDTFVIYKQNNPLQVIDPNGFFSDVKVSTSTEGKFEIIFDITFAKEMEKSDIVLQVRDRSGNSAMLTVHDGWEIVENSDETSEILENSDETSEILVTEESNAFSTDKKSYLRGDTIKFSGKITKEITSRDFVTILIHDSNNRLITTQSSFLKSDGNFKIQLNTQNDFGINDFFKATASIGEEIIGSILFDVSMDKDPIVSAPETKTEQNQETSLETKSVIKEPIKKQIPAWIKNNAKWWSDGNIDDTNFTNGIKYLVNQKIIQTSKTTQMPSVAESHIPSWIKNNAGWWANGLISDDDFLSGSKYLIEQGIIIV